MAKSLSSLVVNLIGQNYFFPFLINSANIDVLNIPCVPILYLIKERDGGFSISAGVKVLIPSQHPQ